MTEQTQIPVEEQPAATKPAVPRFSVVRVLSTALRVSKQNFVPFFAIALVLTVPSILLGQSASADDLWAVFMISLLTSALAVGVVSYGVIMELYGSRPSARVCIATGFKHLGRVIGVTLVTTLAIFVAALALVVPGIVVSLMLYVVVPVTIVERLGIDAAMKRSRELTYGHKSDLFLIVLLGIGVGIVIELVAQLELAPEAALVWRGLAQAASMMFFAVTTAVAYVELRRVRDGIQLPEIATAFARIRKQP
jgi:hypothetical protein